MHRTQYHREQSEWLERSFFNDLIRGLNHYRHGAVLSLPARLENGTATATGVALYVVREAGGVTATVSTATGATSLESRSMPDLIALPDCLENTDLIVNAAEKPPGVNQPLESR